MLRIDRSVHGRTETLTVEGRMVGPWITELRREVEEALERSERVELDLAGVSFAQAEAAELLRRLEEQGANIRRSSTFVEELLRSTRS